tara:strand:- start:700 stop:813 length:114 start_codon:yes stop_codon:yes gene_type:complete
VGEGAMLGLQAENGGKIMLQAYTGGEKGDKSVRLKNK